MTQSKAKTTNKTKKAATTKRKPKTEQVEAQTRLDETLEEKPAKTTKKKIVKQKTAQEELFEMVETYETGRKIGEAAVNTPALGLAIGIGAAITLWQRYQESKNE